MVVLTFNPSTDKAEEGICESKASLVYMQVQAGQAGLQGKTQAFKQLNS